MRPSARQASADERGRHRPRNDRRSGETAPVGDPTPAEVVEGLAELRAQVDDPEAREQVRELMAQVAELQPRGFGNVIVGFDRTDLAEATLGSLLFGIPMFVEGGTAEVGAFVADLPLYLAATLIAAGWLVHGIVYVADFQDVRFHEPILGIVPRRMVGVTGVAFLTALVAMTAWGGSTGRSRGSRSPRSASPSSPWLSGPRSATSSPDHRCSSSVAPVRREPRRHEAAVRRRPLKRVKPRPPGRPPMSETEQRRARKCVSCGINISGMGAARFACPECGHEIYRCSKCRKQSNLYECPDCGFTGP